MIDLGDISAAPTASGFSIYLRLLKYLKPYLGYFFLSLFGYVLFAASQPALAKLMEVLVDAIEAKDTDARYYIPAILLGIYLFRGVGTFLGSYFMALVGNRLVVDLRNDLFRHILHLPVEFYDNNNSGQLMSRITYNTGRVTGAATNAITIVVREGFTIIGLLAYAFYLNWLLSLTFLVIAPIIGLIVLVVGKRIRRLSTRLQNSAAKISHICVEALSGNRTIKSQLAEEHEIQRFSAANLENLNQEMKVAATTAIGTPLMQLVVVAAMSTIVFLILAPSFLGEMSTGMYMSYITAIGLIPKSLKSLSGVNAIIQGAIAAAISIFELMDAKPETDDGHIELPRSKGNLIIRSLSFRYPSGDQNAISDIDIEVHSGEVVALVGRSGSGKSTIASLLARFYDYSEGSILLDGIEIRDSTLASYRQNFGLVSQNVMLFNGTIGDNIAYGDLYKKYSSDEVIAAAKSAYAHEFIENLPDGYQTLVGENGVKLSGGQKQRISIARTLLRNTPILVLDEATSALDNESEHAIQLALENIKGTRTTIVIAHRLSTIQSADQILVLDQGRIIEKGTHSELLKTNSYYRKLYENAFE